MRRPAIGAMRLSTEADRDETRAVDVLHAALDAGITFVDTADAYCWNDSDIGHNERLIARALSTWNGDRSSITVATKGGMTRPEGRWQPDGRGKHLAAACEKSCAALGVNQIDLYQLHVPDPRVPFSTSVRALAMLKRSGLVGAVGLCNVTVGQIEEARRITEIAAVQVELSVFNESSVLSGVVAYCLRHRLPLIAYRPLGGRKSASRVAKEPGLREIANRHAATPAEIALAWLADLSEIVVPIPGVTRVETARSAARASAIVLTGADRELLDQHFPAGRIFRPDRRVPIASASKEGEVVLIMGLPGAGKTRLAQRMAADGFVRLNRDDQGGSLRDLLPALERALQDQRPRIVLDNTYVTRKSRAEVLRVARESGVGVRCVWLTTSVDDAQVNAVTRIIQKYGRLPDEDELAGLRKQDISAFLPTAQFRVQRELEPPDMAEGFACIEEVPFAREAGAGYVDRAVFVWLDGFAMDDALVERLRERHSRGDKLFALSWQPGVAAGTTTRAEVDAKFAELQARSGLAIEHEYCPHAAGPPRCWCRKPLPGLVALLIERHKLDAARSVYIGAGAQDAGYARKLGLSWFADSASLPATD